MKNIITTIFAAVFFLWCAQVHAVVSLVPPIEGLKGKPVPETTTSFSITPRRGFKYDLDGTGRYIIDGRAFKAYKKSPPTEVIVYQQGLDRSQLEPNCRDYRKIVGVIFIESNLWRKIQEKEVAVVPNDPLYLKRGVVGKKLSKVVKGIGTILKIGGFGFGVGPVSVGSPLDEARDQWGLPKVGFTPLTDPASAWNIEDGSRKNVVVAVIDSGLDMTHVDGPRYFWTNPGEIPGNKIDDDGNGYIDDIHGWNFVSENNNLRDDNGHGTFVTGIIAAKTNNGEGIAGINPGAQIMVLKAADRDGESQSLSIYRAIRYAADNGAMVINISLGKKGVSRLEQLGVNYAHARGCVVVVAAGNQGNPIEECGPSGLRRAFSIAAIDMNGKRRVNSNYGANVALAAPGESIYSLTSKFGKRDGQITPLLPTKYHRLSGTSFSAPFVAGTASLLLAKNPRLTNKEIEDIMLETATDMRTEGWDVYTGTGLLDASGGPLPEKEKYPYRTVYGSILKQGKGKDHLR